MSPFRTEILATLLKILFDASPYPQNQNPGYATVNVINYILSIGPTRFFPWRTSWLESLLKFCISNTDSDSMISDEFYKLINSLASSKTAVL